jgi:hypothetical protein
MVKMIAVVVTASTCAGVIVTTVPVITPEVAVSTTQRVEQSTLSTTNVDVATVRVVPTTSNLRSVDEINRPVEQDLAGGDWDQQIVCQQSWPYYERSCLHDGRTAAGGLPVVRIIVTNRSAAGKTTLAGH